MTDAAPPGKAAGVTTQHATNPASWWDDFVRAPDTADDQSDPTAQLKSMLAVALSNEDDPHIQLRRLAAWLLTTISAKVRESEEGAAGKRRTAHNAQRWAAGSSAVVAAGSGGALAGGLCRPAATVVGILVVVAGLASGILSAVQPEAEYVRNRRKARGYEKLLRDIETYTTLTLPTDDPANIATQVNAFTAAIEAVGEA